MIEKRFKDLISAFDFSIMNVSLGNQQEVRDVSDISCMNEFLDNMQFIKRIMISYIAHWVTFVLLHLIAIDFRS